MNKRLAVLPILVALLILPALCTAAPDEYRAFWVDAWGAGVLSQSQVDKLLGVVGDPNSKGDIRNANCNTVIIQVRRNCDANYPSSMGEPYMSGLSPSNFNSLQAVIDAAHDTTGGKQRIDVHAWIVTFRTSGGAVYEAHNDTPTGSLTNLDNYWPSRDNTGAEVGDKAFDPGHPLVEEYTTNVCMDIVNNFDVDGIHYDYIRFTGGNQGYNPTSIARFNARYGRTGQPSTGDDQFDQWRRDQVIALVRKVYAKVQASKPHVKVSGSFVTWNPSPTSSSRTAFQDTRPYGDRSDGVFSDWDAMMQEGIVDMAVPMTYYNWASLPSDYTRWINFEKDRKFNRHMIIGPGIYLNSMQNAINEILMTREASPAGNYADGFSGYSYRVPYASGTWASFSPQLVAQVCPTPANIPDMPWKTAPTKGHISGTVTYSATGKWADGALVSISGPESRTQYCDGTGFYAFIDLTPGAYTITVSKSGYPSAQTTANVQIGQVTGNMYVRDLLLGGTPPPAITNVQTTNITTGTATVTWTTDQTSTSKVEYGTTIGYGLSTPVDNTPVTSHSMTLGGLTQNTTYHFRAISGNANGTTTSNDYTFTTGGPPAISNVQATGITSNSAVITWTTNAVADGKVNYGTTAGYGSQATHTGTGTSHSVTLSGLTAETTYHYQCVSANAYGTATTGDFTFTTTEQLTEFIVDNTDSGWTNTSPGGATWSSGAYTGVPKIGSNYLYTVGSGSTSSVTRSCRWTPNLPVAGNYDVWVYYQLGTNRNPAAPYTVYYNGGQVASVQNQYSTIGGEGGWFLIGSDLPFQAGASGYVELTNASASTALVSADAAKWVLKSQADTTPPVMSVVTDDKYTTSTNSLQAAWLGSDPESGIQRYEYAVGTGPGASNTKNWTNAGPATSLTISGLSLNQGTKYYISVRAVNGENLTSSVLSSEGVTVARPMASIGSAKTLQDNTPIALGIKTVTANFGDRFYVEETNRSSGLCIYSNTSLAPTQQVQIFGRLGLVSGFERILTDCKVVPGDLGAAIDPLFMLTRSLGGGVLNDYTPGFTSSWDLNNIGLLVTIAGKVTKAQAGFIYIDDGFGIEDGSGFKGVRVDATALNNPPDEGQHAMVTGISTIYTDGVSYRRLVRPRDDNDVITYTVAP